MATLAELRQKFEKEREEAAPVVKALKGPKKKKPQGWLSTGAAMLDLGCSGRIGEGYQAGMYYFWVGASSSGKTFLTLLALAEAANSPAFKDYKIIFINAENGAEMLKKVEVFGNKLKSRLEVIPAQECSTIEDFYFLLYDKLSEGPCIVLLDSMDALSSKDEIKNFKKEKNATEKGKEATGSYGMSKAKKNSTDLRIVFNKLVETNSILIMISQERTNIGFDSKFNPTTRSGGKALTFYAGLEMWTKPVGHLKTRVNGKDREQGIVAQVRLKKNRLSGKDRTIFLPIYHSAGIDDIGACVDFLVDEKHWETTKKDKDEDGPKCRIAQGKITADEFDFTGEREKLIQHIVETNGVEKLYEVTQGVWDEIEAKTAVVRPSRYS